MQKERARARFTDFQPGDLLTLQQVADLLSLSRSSCYDAMYEGLFGDVVRVRRGAIRVRFECVQQAIEQLTGPPVRQFTRGRKGRPKSQAKATAR